MDIKMENDKITDSLKFSTIKFQNECADIWKKLVESNSKQLTDEVHKKFESEIKNNIMTTVGGKDMYDYSTCILKKCRRHGFCINSCPEKHDSSINPNNNYVPDYTPEEQKKHEKEITDAVFDDLNIKNNYNNYSDCIVSHHQSIEQFLKMEKGEKIIIMYSNFSYEAEVGHNCTRHICITNYAKIFQNIFKSGTFSSYETHVTHYDFWIPLDYIKIIQTLKPCHPDEILKLMKEMLYDRKFIPLYVKDVVEENEKLRAKYDKDEKDMKQYYEDKKKFETAEKPYLDLIKERLSLNRVRDELELEKSKLKMIVIKLEMDKKEFETEKQKVNEVLKEIKGLDLKTVLSLKLPSYTDLLGLNILDSKNNNVP